MIDGPEALRHSIDNPEPPFDPAYGRVEIVITTDPSCPNELMRANARMLDLIVAYGIADERRDRAQMSDLVDEIAELLRIQGINNSEFTSYWATKDISYSVYKRLVPSEQKAFLHQIICSYLESRHSMYRAHGYSATTLQVKSDSFAHKRTGTLARKKIEAICTQSGLVASNSFARTGMLADGEFAFPDERTARSGFKEFVRRERIRFLWSRDHNGKIPDLIVNLNGIVLIAEHKHIKEGGGGQDKQIVELIEFIRQNESRADIRYMAFLDGIMFNRLMVRHAQGIAEKQRARIYKSLEEYPENYFVNTAGFKSVIQSGTTTI